MKNYGRYKFRIGTGLVIVGGDGHYWPGKAPTAHRAFVHFIAKYKPTLVVQNGDVIDASTISRHPPIGWERFPKLYDELEAAKVRLKEIERVAGDAELVWTLGNHDARFNTRLAMVAKEYEDIHGTRLRDHFPNWRPAWTVDVGGRNGAIITHRMRGGQGAAKANALWAGRTVVTNHTHRMTMASMSDYDHTRVGIETGMLGDPDSLAFKGYTEDNPLDWQPGFVMLHFERGRFVAPEFVTVIGPNAVAYQGKVVRI